MASNKDKAASKARAREKAKARKAEERAQVQPSPEWSAEFRAEFSRLLSSLNLSVELDKLEDVIADLERSLFRERMKPAVAAQEAFRAVQVIMQERSSGKPVPDSIRFRIEEEAGTKFVTFDHFRVRITTAPNGRMDYALDGLEGCDMDAFADIVRLARETRDGEYYLHGVAAYEWCLSTKGTRPTFEELASMARHLYHNEKFSTRFYL